MSKKEHDTPREEPVFEAALEPETEEAAAEDAAQEPSPTEEATAVPERTLEETFQAAMKEQEEKYLRLAAEYDNFRKRSQKEKESVWVSAKADTAALFLPVYDNLERALKQETADEAYAKGVQMTMNQMKTVLEKLGIEEIPAQGAVFDPLLHNAIMHIEDETLGDNTVAEVFQTGFRINGKVIRCAMVKVAN